MSWTGRPANLGKPGHYPTGAELEAILDQIDSLTAPGWTAYTPAWTAFGVAPAIGNGTATGAYRQSTDMDLVIVRGNLTFGSTTTYGTGIYFFSLPVAASAGWIGCAGGTGYALDTAVQEYAGVVKIDGSTTLRILPASNNTDSTANWGPTAPFTFGNGDSVRFQVIYEPA